MARIPHVAAVPESHAAAGARWARSLDRIRWIGPGLVMAATAIGASHLVLAPTAGAAFGYALLWLVPFTHLFKYPAFDFGPRFAVATGASLLEGYARVPGPRGWALWVFLAGTIVQGFSVLAGVLAVAAAVAAAALPGVPFLAWNALLAAVGIGLLWSGRFDGLSALSKWMMVLLAAVTAIAFLATPPPAGAWIDFVRPRLPDGSLVLVAAVLGWMPTGLDVSVWHSMWALERRPVWAERAGAREGAPARVLAIARADLGIGYVLSLVLGGMLLALGVEILRPTGSVPEGAAVAVTIARLYTDVLGGWMWWPFLAAAFFGMFSTTLGVLDGFPRAFEETVRRLRGGPPGRSGGRSYWGFMVGATALALAEIATLRDPVVLVTVAAVASFLISPVTYALNYWCVTRGIADRALRPGVALRVWAVLGALCMAAASILFLALEVGG